jgi:hypothetical protein
MSIQAAPFGTAQKVSAHNEHWLIGPHPDLLSSGSGAGGLKTGH